TLGQEDYQLINHDYNLAPTKPSMDGEPAYEGAIIDWGTSHNINGPRVGADLMRRKAYWAVFAGAFGHTYGHLSNENPYDPNAPPFPNYVIPFPLPYWKDALSATGRTQMQYLRTLVESQPLLGRIPDQSIIASSPGTGDDHVEATRGSNGSYAWVYIPSGG